MILFKCNVCSEVYEAGDMYGRLTMDSEMKSYVYASENVRLEIYPAEFTDLPDGNHVCGTCIHDALVEMVEKVWSDQVIRNSIGSDEPQSTNSLVHELPPVREESADPDGDAEYIVDPSAPDPGLPVIPKNIRSVADWHSHTTEGVTKYYRVNKYGDCWWCCQDEPDPTVTEGPNTTPFSTD